MMYRFADDGSLKRAFSLDDAKLKPLRQARAELRDQVLSFKDAMFVDGRSLSPADHKKLQAVSREIEMVEPYLVAAEARNEDERKATPVSDPDADASERAYAAAGFRRQRPGALGDPNSSGPAQGRTFATMFPAVPLSMDGWRSGGEFLSVIGNGRHDGRLRIEATSGVDDPGGGYAVPTELAAQWLNPAIEGSIVMPRAMVWPMSTRERQVPAFDFGDRSTGGVAGLSLQWESEMGTMDLQASKTRKIKLIAHKGAIYTEVSNELLSDGLGYDAQLNMAIVRAMSYGLDRSFLWGIGGAQPLGVFNAGALITVDKEAGQVAGTIGYENLLKMFSRLMPSSVSNSVWIAHGSTIPQLAMLSIAIGTGGAHVPVMTESNGQFKILTRPVIFTEKAKPLGQLGDIALMDFSQYVVGLRSQMFLESSGHVGFAKDAMTYRATIRVDGQPNIDAPYELPNSAASVSPFVTLQARV